MPEIDPNTTEITDATGTVPTAAGDGSAAAPLIGSIANAPAFPAGWQERVGAFATAVGKTIAEITNALTPLIGPAGADALAILADHTSITDDDLKTALVTDADGLKIPLGVFRKQLPVLRGPRPTTPTNADGATATTSIASKLLPQVPEGPSFLEALRVGGVLKAAGETEVICAVKASIANAAGLYELPPKIMERIEAYAIELGEPVPAQYSTFRKLAVRRSYAEILEALDLGGGGPIVTDRRKDELLGKLNTNFWSLLHGFYQQLVGWQQAWMGSTVGNPALIIGLMAGGQAGVQMPPGMLQQPETAPLHDSAEGVIDQINKIFAGLGIPVARALALDATNINEAIKDPALPAALGATSREQMVKMLGVDVPADIVRLERSVAQFALGILKFKEYTAPADEIPFLGAMLQLGNTIPWDRLPKATGAGRNNGRAGLGTVQARTSDLPEDDDEYTRGGRRR